LELRQHEEAMTAFQTALKLQPKLARAYAGLGGALAEARGDYPEALKYYLVAVTHEPAHPGFLNDLGWLAYKMGRYPEAVAALEKAALLDARNPMVQTNLGLAYQKTGRAEEALRHLHQALAVDPKYPLAFYGLGRTYETQGKYPEALLAYRQAWRVSGNELYLLLWLQTYMESHGEVMFLLLFAFLLLAGLFTFRVLRGRRKG
jgi:Flp pilus assembly protein TadD